MYKYILLSLACIGLLSCESEQKEPAPDVSDIHIDYDIHRFDKVFQTVKNEGNAASELARFEEEYPAFYNLFFERVLPIKGKTKEEFYNNMEGFLSDDRIGKLIDTTEIVFQDFEEVKKGIDNVYKFYKYYFPEADMPDVYTFISEYSNQLFLFPDEGQDGIGLGLDMFLGDDFPYVMMAQAQPAFSRYLSRTFNKKHIPRKIANMLLEDKMVGPKGNRLLDHMIHNGKRLYMLEKVLPNAPDSIILEYTQEQVEWLKDSELAMWAFFFDQELFYESNMMKINKYINQSPDSPGMPSEAPGRTGNYMGLQIVKAYMKKFPETTLPELIAIEDAQLIMDKSRYKPKRK